MKQILLIALAADSNYVPYAHVVMESARRVCSGNLEFALLFCGGNPAPLDKVSVWANQKQVPLRIIPVETINFGSEGMVSHLSSAAFARLLLPRLLPDKQRVLYLDCDVIVRKDLASLFMTTLESRPFAAFCEDKFIRTPRILKLNPVLLQTNDYFNTGVLLCDLDNWRQRGLTEALLKRSHEKNLKLLYGDQDLLNLEIGSEYIKLSGHYNAITRILVRIKPWSFWADKEVRQTFADPAIVHFADPAEKPWRAKGLTRYSQEFRCIMDDLDYTYTFPSDKEHISAKFSRLRQSIWGPFADGVIAGWMQKQHRLMRGWLKG